MGDDDDWQKLSIEEKVSHKLWKARLSGYEEAAKRFHLIDSDKSPEYLNFLGIIKNFVVDSNAAAQEKGLEAALSYVENAACAAKCCSDVVTGIIAKVMTARPKSKQLGVDILLMFIEIEKQDVVMEELVNGFSQKNPKVIAACISTASQALREFGGKVIMMKGLVKLIPTLLSHSDQGVRNETKELAIEIYKWIRDAIKPQLQNIKPVQLKELEDEWQKLDAVPPVPTRFTRSEQAKRAAAPPPIAAGGEQVGDRVGAPQAAAAVFIDPWEMFDPVDILSQLPKDFYEQVESKKWQERKETLEALEKLTSTPKLEAGQYGEICAVLKKVITKDSNVVVVAIAANCVTGLAKGLRKKFQTYSGLLIPAILGKFKEKKLNVVIALRDALDAVFATTNFTNIMEDLLAALDNKNPQIKEETCRFITRTCCTSSVAAFPKSVLKLVAPALVLKLDDTTGSVRDAAAEALGTAMKLVGERSMAVYLEPIDKLKQEKVKEFFDKTVLSPSAGGEINAPAPAVTAPAPAVTAPASASSAKPGPTKPVSKNPPQKEEEKKEKPVTKAPPNKVVKPKSGGAAKKTGGAKGDQKKGKKKGNNFEEDLNEPTEPELPEGVVESQAEELFGVECIKQMASNNWKERLAAVEEMTKKIEGMADKSFPSQVVVRTLAKNPGWKDSNFQVMNVKFKLLAIVAKKTDFTRRSAWYAVAGLISKIGDAKLKTQVNETLKTFAENISLNYISLKIAAAAEEAKNPKLQSEALVWMNEAVREFGFRIDLKPHIAFIKTSLANTNPAVRKAAIEFLATLHIYVGPNIRVFFEEEKAALLQQIDEEFSKVKDVKPTIPIRKFVDDEEEDEQVGGDNQQEAEDDSGGTVVNLEDMVERVNISAKITEEVLAKIADKNWKIRKEGLEEVQGFINEAKFITPDINELPTSIKARLADNNKVLVQLTISICKQLAESGGSGMIRHKATILPALIGTFTDAKPALRNLAEEALDAWHSKIGFVPFLDGEILSTSLQVQNPNLRATLLNWLEKKLPNEKKLPPELKESILPLYVCLEDRNPDVRKAAQAVVPLFMAHVGFDSMSKATAKLDAASKVTVQAIIDKAREVCVPIAAPGKKIQDSGNKQALSATQPTKSSTAPAKVSSEKSDMDVASLKSSKEVQKKPKEEKPVKPEPKKSIPPKSSGGGRKKDFVEDDGPPIILKVGKAQRIKDEKALKVLKWNFTVPRDEFLDQLKEQMMPCFSPSMHAKFFHKDFKFHIEALSILISCVTEYSEAVIESLDLILKWVSLRFFDTNTTVLLKALEFLTVLFNFLESSKQKLNSFEASAFIPYLVGKIGDPKDNIRKSVHDLCKLVTNIYPASQMFVYLMQGLESKNSKSRMECCEELGFLISKFGIDVCQPSPKVLKDIAVQIADRDNGVRSAALNCIVEAYNIVGEQVYKLIGKLADKEMGYLEERIKRTGNKKEAPPKQLSNVKPRQPVKSVEDSSDSTEAIVQVKQELNLVKAAVTAKAIIPPSPQIKREFELDLHSIEGDEGVITAFIPQLKKVNLDDITQAASIPDNLLKAYSSSSKISSTNTSSAKDVGELLDLTIAKISSSDVQAAMESLVQLEDVFRKKKTDNEIVKRVDQYLVTSLVQMKMLFSRHVQNPKDNSEEHERLLKLLLSGMLSLFDAQCYAGVVSYNVLKDVILYFITVLNDKLLMNFQEPDLSIQCVNRLLLRVITNSNKTSCLCSCVKLLQDMSENENTSTSLIKLVMKCIWKLTHLLPDFVNEVRLPTVLQSIHTFYTVLPPSLWRARTDRVPQQTVKALLQTLCKLRGPELYDSINTLENKNASEVPLYIMKHCSKGTLENSLSQETSNPPPIRFTQPSNEVLVEIFKKIGSKENSRAGILELHYFKQQYPDYDVNPYIKNTSPFFQNFIDRSLKTIATEEKLKLNNNRENSSQSIFSSSHTSSGSDSEKYMDRLRILKEKFQKSSQSQPSTNSTSDEPLIETQVETIKAEKDHLKVDVKVEEKKNFDLDDIKKRLALIKGTNR